MTCIAGIERGGRVYIGGDSAGTNAVMRQVIRRDPKVYSVGDFVIGFAGSFRMGQAIRYGLIPPVHPKGMAQHEFLCTHFVAAMRTALDKGKFGTKRGEGILLVGYHGKLYEVDSSLQVGLNDTPFGAVGAGADVAIGVLHALHQRRQSPERVITKALEAASRYNASVRPPFVIISK